MPRKRPDFGPSPIFTVEVGDRFTRTIKGRATVYIVVGKVYNDDLTISYRMISTRGNYWRKSLLHERTITGTSLFKRTFKTEREVLMTEHNYGGVYFGAA